MKRKRLLSWVLTLAMLAGMLTVPAMADGNTTTISGDGTEDKTGQMTITLKIKGTPTAGDFSFAPPASLTYDGQPKTATVTSSKDGMGEITLDYYSGTTKLGGAPTADGTYTVKVNVAEGDEYKAATDITDASWTFTVAPYSTDMRITLTIPAAAVTTEPTAKTGLKYNGSTQALVTEGTAENGTMEYAIGENGTTAPTTGWSSELPTGTEAGTYHVWYRAASPHGNTDAAYLSAVEIAPDTYAMTITLVIVNKDTQTITASDVNAIYGDTDKSVSATTDGNGAISYAVKSGSEDYIDVDVTTGALTIKMVPADGKAYVTVTAAETSTGGTGGNGYAEATKDVTVNISKADPTATAPTGLTATYGQTLAEVTLANPDGNTAGTWAWVDVGTTSVGNVGSNTFKANFTPTDTNYNSKSNVDVTVTVDKATLTNVSVAQNGTLTYTGEAQSPQVSTAATAVNNQTVTFTYSKTQNGTYGDMPTVTDVADGGTFYYKATAPNHEDATGSFTVTMNKGSGATAIPADIPNNTTTAVDAMATLTFDAVAGQEYTLAENGAEPDWTNTLTVENGKISLDGLNSGDRYAVYTRVAETNNTLAGEAVSTPFVTEVNGYGWSGDADSPNLIGGTLTAEFDAVAELTYQWFRCDDKDGTNESPIQDATAEDFTVPADLEGKYFFAKAFIDGIEVGSFEPIGPVAYATITFDSKGGSAVEPLTGLTYGQELTRPDDPIRARFFFEGWYKDEGYKEAWSFDMDAVSDVETTLYAKWSAVPVHTIEGIVRDSDGNPLADVTVTLMQGDTTYGATTTGTDGKFSFSAVEGAYNVVAEKDKLTKTELVKLKENQTLVIIMPEAGKNSVLDNSDAGDFAATVGGLDEIAAGQQVQPNQSVTVTLSVVAEANVRSSYSAAKQAAFAASKDAIETLPQAQGKAVDYLDLNLEKTVDDGANTETTEIEDNDQLLVVIIPYDTSGKTNFTVFRDSADGAEAMQQNPGEGQEGFTVGNGAITIYTKDATTYGIGYNTVSHSSGSGGGGAAPATNPVNVPSASASAASHGSVKSSAANAKAGDKVTVTPEPDEGYVTTGVTVTDANGKTVPVTKNADGTYSFTMPSTAVTVTPTFAKAEEQSPADDGSCPKDATCPISKFTDATPTAWYHDGVHWALVEGVMNGTSDTTFAPDGTATRAMVVTMLWRLAGEPAVSSEPGFTDVSSDAWYAQAVAWAAESGAVKGISDTTFSPNTPVTREQLAAILYRFAQAQGKGFTGSWMFPLDYPDAAEVSDYANEAMHWMTMHGVITGMGDGTLAPQDNATRAQIATMFMRFCAEMEQ